MAAVTWLVSDGSVQPTRTEWYKFRRYASWMRRLYFNSRFPEEVLRLISTNLPNGTLFPGLRDLSWVFQPHTLPFYRLFLSPRLTHSSLYYSPAFRARNADEVFSSIASMILELDTLPLQSFRLGCPTHVQASRSLESAVSSAVLRWGPSLTSLSVSVPLSDAAVQHILRLPNLTAWRPMDGPPRVPDLSLSDAFPRLENLVLETEESLQWLPFFEAAARRIAPEQETHTPPNRGPCQKLIILECWVQDPVDIAFMTPITLFHGLINLTLVSYCSTMPGCIFSLTDDNIEKITTALPRLSEAIFGRVCSANSCRTTVSSLISFSIHCKSLVYLEIHFNTTNLRSDLDSVSTDPRLDNLPSFPEGEPFSLSLLDVPISISKEDIGPVARGFCRIFPQLERFEGIGTTVEELNRWLVDKE